MGSFSEDGLRSVTLQVLLGHTKTGEERKRRGEGGRRPPANLPAISRRGGDDGQLHGPWDAKEEEEERRRAKADRISPSPLASPHQPT